MDIYKAISAVMADIGAIQKNDMNTYDKYKYRGIDAVYNAIQPALVKNGVFIVPALEEIEQTDRVSRKGEALIHTRVRVRYEIYADDGSSITVAFPGEAADRSDKSINKAMTAAYKYMLFELFCIPTEDLTDSDKDSPEVGTKATQKVADEAAGGETMTKSQVDRLKKTLEEKGVPYKWALNMMGVDGTPTKVQGNLMVYNVDRLAEKYKGELAVAEGEA